MDFRELQNAPAGKVDALVADDLETDGLVAKAVLAQDLDAPDKGHPRRFILVEEVAPQKHKVNLKEGWRSRCSMLVELIRT